MNPVWKEFLVAQHARVTESGEVRFTSRTGSGEFGICPVPQFGILRVSGADAAKLLQGQCTCDINTLAETRAGMGGICNPKGRAIATFLIVKREAEFFLLLPAELLETVQTTLQRYVLRAKATISDVSDAYALIGVCGTPVNSAAYPWPDFIYGVVPHGQTTLLRYPVSAPRFLTIATIETAPQFWNALRRLGFAPMDSALWRQLDIEAGIPWLDMMNSEQYIPQMLNLDALGGIGFSKGCYTGQEVVARTQYLGTVKRRLYYAECNPVADVALGMTIFDHDAGGEPFAAGKLLSYYRDPAKLQLLLVLQTSNATSKNLRLENVRQDKITIIPLTYVSGPAD